MIQRGCNDYPKYLEEKQCDGSIHTRIDMLIIDKGLLLLCRIRFSVTKGISYQLLYSNVIVYFCSSSSFCLYFPINTCRVDGCKQGYMYPAVRAKNQIYMMMMIWPRVVIHLIRFRCVNIQRQYRCVDKQTLFGKKLTHSGHT